MAPRGSKQRGHVRRRGNSWQVLYAGVDPVTGKELRLTGSESSEAAAYRLLDKFRAQLTEQRHAKTKATFRAAMETFLGLRRHAPVRPHVSRARHRQSRARSAPLLRT